MPGQGVCYITRTRLAQELRGRNPCCEQILWTANSLYDFSPLPEERVKVDPRKGIAPGFGKSTFYVQEVPLLPAAECCSFGRGVVHNRASSIRSVDRISTGHHGDMPQFDCRSEQLINR